MNSEQEIKTIVREKYAEIALRTGSDPAGCGCGCGCGPSDVTVMSDDYKTVEGYVPEADLGLGCGIPTEIAAIQPGHTVLDLGSGAGNDVFVARRTVGESGQVIGVDMTEAMVDKANENKRNLGYTNVDFRLGEIENLPVESGSVDVVISNCVLNLVPDKRKAFAEIRRVLKPNGHFSISDIVVSGELPPAIRDVAALYAGCVAGALTREEYLGVIAENGFTGVSVKKDKPIDLPDDLLLQFIGKEDLRDFRKSGIGISSITVYGEKP